MMIQLNIIPAPHYSLTLWTDFAFKYKATAFIQKILAAKRIALKEMKT